MSVVPCRSWVGIITPHARQRYIERISSPQVFAHLRSGCKKPGCSECINQAFQLRSTSVAAAKYVDREIRDRIAQAQAAGDSVKNPSFLEVVKKTCPIDREFEFWRFKTAVFVIIRPDNEPSPVLLTVLSDEMIDGTVIRSSSRDELSMYFDRWKREARTHNSDREIRRL